MNIIKYLAMILTIISFSCTRKVTTGNSLKTNGGNCRKSIIKSTKTIGMTGTSSASARGILTERCTGKMVTRLRTFELITESESMVFEAEVLNDGSYSINDFPHGRVKIIISDPRYGALEVDTIGFESGEVKRIDITLGIK